ncbi:MAG: glycosyltransferase, partial [Acidimicrobiales bacterium]
VVTRIPGHADAVVDGHTGLLAGSPAELEASLELVLGDEHLRNRLGAAAWSRAQDLTWDATAHATLRTLADEAIRRRRPRGRHR